jgi:hypothetical protein
LDLLVSNTPTNRQKIEELGDRLGASAVGPWLELPVATIVPPTERHSVLLSSLLTSGQASGPLYGMKLGGEIPVQPK